MRTTIALKGWALPRQQLTAILADYLALDRARDLRRQLMARCGLLALAVVVVGLVFPGLPASGYRGNDHMLIVCSKDVMTVRQPFGLAGRLCGHGA